MDAVKKTLKDNMLDMQAKFEERMAGFETDLQKKSFSSSDLARLAEEFVAFKSFITLTLKNLQMQVTVLAREMDCMETRNRRKILLFHGIKERKDEVTVEVVCETIKNKFVMDSFTAHDIRRCHRMGRQQSGDKPRPILVKFQSCTFRDSIWSAKTKLKGTGFTISEFLTRSRHACFMSAREKYGVSNCWTREGTVFVISPDGSRHRISAIDDLNNIRGTQSEKHVETKTVPPKQRRAAASKK